MKSKILFVFLSIFSLSFAQVEIKPEIGIAGTFAVFGIYNSHNVEEVSGKSSTEESDYKYIGVNTYLGGRILIKNISILLSMNYQHLVSGGYADDLTRSDFRKSDLLGFGLEMRFFETSKIRPYLSAQLLSELNSNYKNKHLVSELFAPRHKQVPEHEMWYYTGHNTPGYNTYKATLYQSTPFLGNFYGGCDFTIIKNVDLNLAVGYNLSLLNYKYAVFGYDPDLKTDYRELMSTKPIRTVSLHSFSMQLGLRYNIPLKLNTSIYE